MDVSFWQSRHILQITKRWVIKTGDVLLWDTPFRPAYLDMTSGDVVSQNEYINQSIYL